MGVLQTIAPYAEPIHLAEAKAYRVDVPDEDAPILRRLIKSARSYVEKVSGWQLVVATYQLKMNGWYDPEYRKCDGAIWLPHPPLVSISSITYLDSNGSTQTLSTTYYTVDAEQRIGKLYEAPGQIWPVTYYNVFGQSLTGMDVPASVTITYLAGFLTPVSAATTDTWTASGRTFSDTTRIRLTNSGGDLPGGFAMDTDYFIRDSSSSTFKLAATSGGTAIDVTDTGSGQSFASTRDLPENLWPAMQLLIGNGYEFREGNITGTIISEIPRGIMNMIAAEEVGEYA